nr:hypothetical protein [Tanacetum cinerariifolium]
IIKPINYDELNALYSHFVPQKELSREQVYWLPAEELATQKVTRLNLLDENLVKEVTEFMRIFDELDKEYEQCVLEKNKLRIKKKNLLIQNECLITDCVAKDIWSIVLASDRDRHLSEELRSNCVREKSKVIKLEAEILKQQQMLAESYKRWKDDTIRKLQTQINNINILNVEPTVGSFDKQALETELTQLKDAITSVRTQNDGFKLTAFTAANAKLKSESHSKMCSEPIVPEKPKVLAPGMYAIRVKPATGASKPMSKSDTRNHSTLSAKREKARRVGDHHRNLNKQNHVDSCLNVKRTGFVLNLNTVCDACNESLVFANHDNCVVRNLKSMNVKTPMTKHNVKTTKKVWKAKVVIVRSQWKPTGRRFTLYDEYPLTRIVEPIIEPLELTSCVSSNSKVTMISRFTDYKLSNRKADFKGIFDSGCSRHMTGDRSKLTNYVDKFIGTVRFEKDQFAAIIGYGDYKLGNTIISRVYYVEGLSHNLFSVEQFCDGGLEVAFRKHTYHIRNNDMVDLLQGKSKKSSHPLKTVNTNTKILNTLHMDLYGPMRIESINKKKYILVIVDDYTRFGWVRFLRTKDETLEVIKKFIVTTQRALNATARYVRTDNGTEFVNKTLTEFFESVGITHNTSVPRSLQQNGVVERRNRTLMQAARTMLIFAKALLFLWAEAVTTACYTLKRSLLKAKADIGIFVGYTPTKKAYRIFNKRTHKIQETVHVTFDELSEGMTSVHSSTGLEPNTMAPMHNGAGLDIFALQSGRTHSELVNDPTTPSIPPSAKQLEELFQPMFRNTRFVLMLPRHPKLPLDHLDVANNVFHEDVTNPLL